jgi:2-amino-4-hydroxy-6-hydroxymethyldihydropteridine diphosphokinase
VHDEDVYLGLGSNLGDRSAHLRAGLAGLCDGGLRLRAVSSLYLTEPDLRETSGIGTDSEHPDYINCVASFEADLEPRALLDLCLAVERDQGRERSLDTTVGPQPRTLDIDVLLIGQHVVDEPGLTVPHPLMMQRRFVLQPLAEIAPSLRHPLAQSTIGEALARLPGGNGVSLLEPPPDEVI